MSKKHLNWLMVVLLITLGFVSGCGSNKSAQDTNAAPAQPKVAVIDMDKAVKAHPKSMELLQLKQQYNALADKVQAELQAKAQANVPDAQAIPKVNEAAINGINSAMEQEFNAKMAAKQAELKERLAAKAAQLKSDMANELKAYTAEIDKDYQPKIFSLQLKLKTVQLSKDEMAGLQQDMEKLQNERADKIAAKDRELAARLDAAMAPEQAKAEAELAAYAKQLNSELSAQASAKSAEIAARPDVPTVVPQIPDSGRARTDTEQQLAMKKQEINVLEEHIMQDIRDKAAKVAVGQGLEIVLSGVTVNVNAQDITDAVITEFKN